MEVIAAPGAHASGSMSFQSSTSRQHSSSSHLKPQSQEKVRISVTAMMASASAIVAVITAAPTPSSASRPLPRPRNRTAPTIPGFISFTLATSLLLGLVLLMFRFKLVASKSTCERPCHGDQVVAVAEFMTSPCVLSAQEINARNGVPTTTNSTTQHCCTYGFLSLMVTVFLLPLLPPLPFSRPSSSPFSSSVARTSPIIISVIIPIIVVSRWRTVLAFAILTGSMWARVAALPAVAGLAAV